MITFGFSGLPYNRETLAYYVVKLVRVIRVTLPLVLTSECKVFWLALAQCGDFSCLCFSSGGDVVSDAAGSGGSSKKKKPNKGGALCWLLFALPTTSFTSSLALLVFLILPLFLPPTYGKWCSLLREGTDFVGLVDDLVFYVTLK